MTLIFRYKCVSMSLEIECDKLPANSPIRHLINQVCNVYYFNTNCRGNNQANKSYLMQIPHSSVGNKTACDLNISIRGKWSEFLCLRLFCVWLYKVVHPKNWIQIWTGNTFQVEKNLLSNCCEQIVRVE